MTQSGKQISQSRVDFSSFITPAESIFELVDLTVAEIAQIIQAFAANKASGLDGIPVALLKIGAPVIVKSLTHIFNLSINRGILPTDWKSARVSPIYKDGAKSTLNNYRPISVLSVFAKIIERAIFNKFYAYLVTNNLLNKYQSGFRPRHWTVTALL